VSAASTVVLAPLAGALPPAPSPTLDRYLDAALRCFTRYGITRTTAADVAAELGVTRATVYRHGGSVDTLARALFARELHRLLTRIPEHIGTEPDADTVVAIATLVAESARAHPVLAKLLADEPERARSMLLCDLEAIVEQTEPFLAPLLGIVAPSSCARTLTGWLVRTVVVLLLAPVPGDLRAYLNLTVRPVLVAASVDPPTSTKEASP
jgi:AcrR family transcriptional regulator